MNLLSFVFYNEKGSVANLARPMKFDLILPTFFINIDSKRVEGCDHNINSEIKFMSIDK
jgi:hypothetical protein